MKTKEILDNLDHVQHWCTYAASKYKMSETLDWTDKSYEQIALYAKESMEHIENLECQITDMGWELNPDRMGQ